MDKLKIDKSLKLVVSWCVDDNWYGEYYRIIVSKSEHSDFKNKKEANQYKTMLKFYMEKIKSIKNSHISIGPADSYVEFTYRGAFPSLYYNTSYITLEKLYSLTVNEIERYDDSLVERRRIRKATKEFRINRKQIKRV